MNDAFLNEAISIGNNIIDGAIHDFHGIHWKCYEPDGSSQIKRCIYSGSSGIILFLVELYFRTNDVKYYNAAVEASNWLVKNQGDSLPNLAYYTGYGGEIVALCKVYELTKDSVYIISAENIFKSNRIFKNIDPVYLEHNDLLNGISGYILSLFHLIKYSNNELVNEIHTDINLYLEILLSKVFLTKDGICWDRNGNSIRPLCGFAHGVSGIALLFFELYTLTNSEIFLNIANHALSYEDAHFDKENQNWPDYRKDVSRDGYYDLVELYKKGNMDAFVKHDFMFAWCHGAPGINMTRITAFQATKNFRYLDNIESTINSIYDSTFKNTSSIKNATLCHGVLGNAELLIEAYNIFEDNLLLKKAQKIGLQTISDRKNYGYYRSGYPNLNLTADFSFFMGQSGIGYYYLRLLDPLIPSLLRPKIPKLENPGFLKVEKFADRIFKKFFVNTYRAIDKHPQDDILGCDNLMQSFVKVANEFAANNSTASEIVNIDFRKNDLISQTQSDIYLRIKKDVESLKNYELLNSHSSVDLYSLTLVLNNDLVLESFNVGNETKHFILFPTFDDNGATQYDIGEFINIILGAFLVPTKVQNAYRSICSKCELETTKILEFNRLFEIQVRKCIEANFLLILT